MERTESNIIQVSPSYENNKIKEMEMFGWSLQNRQEIHEEGDAYGAPSFTGSSYVTKTRVSKYVKLHFVRNLSLPNLEKIKQIESEYFALAFPPSPSLTGPSIFTVFGIIGIFTTLGGKQAGPTFVGLVWVGIGIFWILSRIKKQKAAKSCCEQSIAKMEELKAQLKSLTT